MTWRMVADLDARLARMLTLYTTPPPDVEAPDAHGYSVAPPADQSWLTVTYRGVVTEYTTEGGRIVNPYPTDEEAAAAGEVIAARVDEMMVAPFGPAPLSTETHTHGFSAHAPLIAAPVRSTQPGVDAFHFDPAVGDDEIAAWDAILHPQADA